MIIQPIIKAMLEKNMNNRTAKRRRLRRLLVGLTIKIWASGRFGIADFFHAIHPKIVIGLVTHISAKICVKWGHIDSRQANHITSKLQH